MSFRRILREATSRGSARKVIGAFVEALSVWDDVRARCYVAGANGGFLAYGASLAAPPSTHDYLDDAVAPAHGRIVRLSRTEIEDLGLISEPGDSLMLRILAGDVAWLLLFSGMIDDREQVRLRVYSDILRESLNDAATMATSRLVVEVSRPQRPTNEPPETSGQIALEQLMGAVGATRGALVLTGSGRPALTVGLTELLSRSDEPSGNRLVVKSSDGDSVMAVVFEREPSAFTALDRETTLAGMAVVHRWLQTGLQRSSDGERRRRFRPIDSVFDQLATNAIATGRHASVIVMSVDALRRARRIARVVGREDPGAASRGRLCRCSERPRDRRAALRRFVGPRGSRVRTVDEDVEVGGQHRRVPQLRDRHDHAIARVLVRGLARRRGAHACDASLNFCSSTPARVRAQCVRPSTIEH